METNKPDETAIKFDYLWAKEYWSNSELYARFALALIDNFDFSPTGLAKTIFDMEEHYAGFIESVTSNPDYIP